MLVEGESAKLNLLITEIPLSLVNSWSQDENLKNQEFFFYESPFSSFSCTLFVG